MADVAFPVTPALYDVYTSPTGQTWYWDGVSWRYGQGPGVADPSFASVTYLNHCDAPGCQRNVGSVGGIASASALSTVVTRFAAVSIQTTAGGGVAGIAVGSNAGWTFGTPDFTLNLAINPIVLAAKNIWDFRAGGASVAVHLSLQANGAINMGHSGVDRIIGTAGTCVVGTWAEIELARVGAVTRLFVNGVQSGSNYADTTNYVQGGFTIGNGNLQAGIGDSGPSAYFGEIRITKGVGRHSANFTPATGRYPDR